MWGVDPCTQSQLSQGQLVVAWATRGGRRKQGFPVARGVISQGQGVSTKYALQSTEQVTSGGGSAATPDGYR